MNKFDNPLISDKFRNCPTYPDFLRAAADYVNLDWEGNIKANPVVIENLAILGAFFAWEFGINADQALKHVIDIQSARHPRDATSYRDILAFTLTERATKNIRGDKYGICAHVHPALDAAENLGAEVSILRRFISGEHRGNYMRLPAIVRRFAKESLSYNSYVNDKDSCLGVLGLARELLLDQVFLRISYSLPDDPKYTYYKEYLDAHVSIDTSDHGPKMAKILNDCVTKPELAVQAAADFLDRRTKLYQVVLNLREPLIPSLQR